MEGINIYCKHIVKVTRKNYYMLTKTIKKIKNAINNSNRIKKSYAITSTVTGKYCTKSMFFHDKKFLSKLGTKRILLSLTKQMHKKLTANSVKWALGHSYSEIRKNSQYPDASFRP
jgi:hypothetical protein